MSREKARKQMQTQNRGLCGSKKKFQVNKI